MNDKTAETIEVIRYEKPVPYREAYAAQIERRNAIEAGECGEALFLLEHTPTFTLGRSSDENHILQSREALAKMGIEVVEIDRGGDVTYHGPGQLVGYPILDLTRRRQSIQWYLRALEEVIIDTLATFDLRGERMEGFTGVWVDGAKVAAIGIGIHNWVTYHGIAINVAPNMEHWGLIVPCGIPDKPVTSLAALLGRSVDTHEVVQAFSASFFNHLGATHQ